jgi:hypothetical protein
MTASSLKVHQARAAGDRTLCGREADPDRVRLSSWSDETTCENCIAVMEKSRLNPERFTESGEPIMGDVDFGGFPDA